MRSPLAETQLGGGIWRIKWDPFTADYILTATMYNGFHLVDASEFTGMHLNIFLNQSKQNMLGYRRGCGQDHDIMNVFVFYQRRKLS
jgi:hypothetical protein